MVGKECYSLELMQQLGNLIFLKKTANNSILFFLSYVLTNFRLILLPCEIVKLVITIKKKL